MELKLNVIKNKDGSLRLEPYYSANEDEIALIEIQKHFLEDGEEFLGLIDGDSVSKLLADISNVNGEMISETAGFNGSDSENYLVQMSSTFSKNVWINAKDEESALEHAISSNVIYSDIDFVYNSTDYEIIS